MDYTTLTPLTRGTVFVYVCLCAASVECASCIIVAGHRWMNTLLRIPINATSNELVFHSVFIRPLQNRFIFTNMTVCVMCMCGSAGKHELSNFARLHAAIKNLRWIYIFLFEWTFSMIANGFSNWTHMRFASWKSYYSMPIARPPHMHCVCVLLLLHRPVQALVNFKLISPKRAKKSKRKMGNRQQSHEDEDQTEAF